MSPERTRNRMELWLGGGIAALTPLAVWSYLYRAYPDLPPLVGMHPDLLSYLLNKVLMFTFLIEVPFFVVFVLMHRMKMVKMMLIVSAMYAIIAIVWRWEWL
jgi:hypothetical protein